MSSQAPESLNEQTQDQQQQLTRAPVSHAPSVAGSVIEASDGLGGSILIRIQNIASTGKRVVCLLFVAPFLFPIKIKISSDTM